MVDAGNKDSRGGKRKAYKKILQRNLPEEVRERRKREYRDSKALVKRLVRESKERVDEDFGRSYQQSMWKTRSYSGEKSGRKWEGERVKPAG